MEPLIPLANLPNPIQERLREKRNKILDALEEEERQAEQDERERESIEKEENTHKRREEAAKERERLQQARELQKKMGRALLQDVGKAKQKEEQEKEAQRLRDQEEDQKRKSPSVKKKTVAFVGIPGRSDDTKHEQSNPMDWGDITPARLQPSKRRTLMSPSLLDKHPMKMSVVERVPGGQPTIPKSPPPFSRQNAPDSDDESNPEDTSECSESDISDEEPILETDEVDYDFAQHQREIALQYYKKRNTIGQEAAKATMNHVHDLDEDLTHVRVNYSCRYLFSKINKFRYRTHRSRFVTPQNQLSLNSKPADLLLLTVRQHPSQLTMFRLLWVQVCYLHHPHGLFSMLYALVN